MSTCVRGVVVVPQRMEVGEDSLEILDSFHYLGDVISCEGGVEMVVRDRLFCTWSKWKELASIPLEERVNQSLLYIYGTSIAFSL